MKARSLENCLIFSHLGFCLPQKSLSLVRSPSRKSSHGAAQPDTRHRCGLHKQVPVLALFRATNLEFSLISSVPPTWDFVLLNTVYSIFYLLEKDSRCLQMQSTQLSASQQLLLNSRLEEIQVSGTHWGLSHSLCHGLSLHCSSLVLCPPPCFPLLQVAATVSLGGTCLYNSFQCSSSECITESVHCLSVFGNAH